MATCLYNYFPHNRNVLWVDIETNNDDCMRNKILEIYAQYSDWYDPERPPVASFYALVLPESTVSLCEDSVPSFDRFVDSLDLSSWCASTFANNGLLDDLYNEARSAADTVAHTGVRAAMSIESVAERFVSFLDSLNSTYIFAGKNVHYDVTVLSKFVPAIYKRAAKHVYDTGPLSFISIAQTGVMPSYSSASGDHRAVTDVKNTKLTNRDLVDSLVIKRN